MAFQELETLAVSIRNDQRLVLERGGGKVREEKLVDGTA